MKTPRIALLLSVVLLSACATAQTVGNGVAREETRELADFDSVRVSHGVRARVTVGPKAVHVSGDENLVGLVRTEVVDGELVVRLKRNSGVRSTSRLLVTVSSPQLTRVEASGGAVLEAEVTGSDSFSAEANGGGIVSVRSVDTKKLKVEANGGAQVNLQGRAAFLEVEANGGALVHARELTLQALEVDANAGSQVEANPSERLVAEVSSGSILTVDNAPPHSQVSSSSGAQVHFRKK